MPIQLDLGRLNEGEGVVTTPMMHSAQWYKMLAEGLTADALVT